MLASDLDVEKPAAHIEALDTVNGHHLNTTADVAGTTKYSVESSCAVLAPIQDEAFEFLRPFGGSIRYVSAKENARLLRKIDRHLMPILFVIYFLQFMDKQTLSFTSVFGLAQDTGLVGDDYSMLGSIVYIAQLVVQPFFVYILVRSRMSMLVPTVLGALEASIVPAFVIIGQMWYRRHEQGFRIAIWYSSNGWVNIFGSLIVYGLAHIKSDVLHTYQIIFLVLGALTCLVGALSFFLFPDNPVRCNFLTTEEKILALERIRANQQGLETKTFKFSQVIEMFLDIKSWLGVSLLFVVAIPNGGIITFGPLILRGLGFDGYKVTLLTIIFGALQILALFGGFWATRRFRMQGPILLLGLLPCIAGTTILICTGRNEKDQPLLLFAYYLLASYNILNPVITYWQSSNVAGHTKKTATSAFMSMGSIGGNIVGPLLFSPRDKPYYHSGIVAMLASFCMCALITILQLAYLRRLNNANVVRRTALGKSGKIADYSMLSASEAEAQRSKEDGDPHTLGRHAFDDLTDLQNDEFIVSRFQSLGVTVVDTEGKLVCLLVSQR
ncbi:allantoate permease [Phlegmacium glaucopus]|nr:allantoate permease [Phlegmacium glaucopus]